MSTTMEGIDARGYLAGWLDGVSHMTVADIKAVPDDKWTATFGGCTRPANELMADAISLLVWCTDALNGKVENETYMDMIQTTSAACATKDATIEKFTSASQELGAAIKGASDETLNSVVTPPWQMPAPLYVLCQIAVSHIWYHDGQLNYIHCLLGDGKVHWMGD